MSDQLPSREEATQGADWFDWHHGRELRAIVRAYAEGRLVDRETIDWAAINEKVGTWAARELGSDWIGTVQDISELLQRELDAALGVSEDE
jgi:hypothetical protein